jgi:T-complex protein 1 subunit alpha
VVILIACFGAQVIVAAELLKNADDLVKSRIHPTSIISGYRLACK